MSTDPSQHPDGARLDRQRGPGERPRLRRGVRLSHDRVRDTPVVLHPEGVLMPNATATAVLELCDGHRDLPTIARTLAERYDGVQEEQIRSLLERLAEKQVIEWT